MLLGFPQSLQPRSRALVPHSRVLLPESLAIPLEELGQHRVSASVGPIFLQLSRESQVRALALLTTVRFVCVKVRYTEAYIEAVFLPEDLL